MKLMSRWLLSVVFLSLVSGLGMVRTAAAASAAEIDAEVNAALATFTKDVEGGTEFLQKAKGVLVFPSVIKGGFMVGGEFGEGALRIGGESVAYYNIASASFGLQMGAQKYGILMVFLTEEALKTFQESKGWEAGVDASVALITVGAGKDINTENFKDPVVGFVFDTKGLMAGISLEGSKITKTDK